MEFPPQRLWLSGGSDLGLELDWWCEPVASTLIRSSLCAKRPIKGLWCSANATPHVWKSLFFFKPVWLCHLRPSGVIKVTTTQSPEKRRLGRRGKTPSLSWPRPLLPELFWNQSHKPQTWLWSGRPPTAACTSRLYTLAWHSCHLLLIPVSGCRPPGAGHQKWCCVFQRIDMWSLGVTAAQLAAANALHPWKNNCDMQRFSQWNTVTTIMSLRAERVSKNRDLWHLRTWVMKSCGANGNDVAAGVCPVLQRSVGPAASLSELICQHRQLPSHCIWNCSEKKSRGLCSGREIRIRINVKRSSSVTVHFYKLEIIVLLYCIIIVLKYAVPPCDNSVC